MLVVRLLPTFGNVMMQRTLEIRMKIGDRCRSLKTSKRAIFFTRILVRAQITRCESIALERKTHDTKHAKNTAKLGNWSSLPSKQDSLSILPSSSCVFKSDLLVICYHGIKQHDCFSNAIMRPAHSNTG